MQSRPLHVPSLLVGGLVVSLIAMAGSQAMGLTALDRRILDLFEIVHVPDGQGGLNLTLRLNGADLQIVNGTGATETANGVGNLILGYNEPGFDDDRTGSHNLVVGPGNQYSSHGGVAVGQGNRSDAPFAAALGGFNNWARGDYSTIAGGAVNSTDGFLAGVYGGAGNLARGRGTWIGGGSGNQGLGDNVTVLGTAFSIAGGNQSMILGGANNATDGLLSMVKGGLSNTANGDFSTVNGGQNNRVEGFASTIGGGVNLVLLEDGTWIGGDLGSGGEGQ